jgi:hypothetical protein
LVENDYESVMPLPRKSRYGIPYLIQPKFAQQLGIFSIKPIESSLVAEFLKKIPKKFVWQVLYLNSACGSVANTKLTPRVNIELSLNNTYKDLKQLFNQNTRRNINKANKLGCTVINYSNTDEYIRLFQLHPKFNPSKEMVNIYKNIAEQSLQKKMGTILLAQSANGEPIAGALYLQALNRIVYLGSFNSLAGQESSAMFGIMNHVIENYASGTFILDFEGSVIPGIAQFFEGFGGKRKDYFEYRHFWGQKNGH